jgi:hypothetical protein
VQAERRLERSRNATTAAVPLTEAERALVAALLHLRFRQIVLIVRLRQDENLDSHIWLEPAKAGSMMPLNPIMGQANACIAKAPLK